VNTSATTNTHATIQEPLEVVSSMQSMPRLYNDQQSVVSCPDQSFTAALCTSKEQYQQQPSQQQSSGHHIQPITNQTSGKSVQATNVNSNGMDNTFTVVITMQQVTNQSPGKSVQAKNVNSNAADKTFAVVTMIQQIMTGLSGAATKEEQVAITTKAVFSLLKGNGNNSS
jgi:hypothetical protein